MLRVFDDYVHLWPSGKQSIEFSIPYFKGVTMIDFSAINNRWLIYYGDEIDLDFWELLGLQIGNTWIPENPLTLQSGWRYDYYAMQHRFEVYRINNALYSITNNVQSIADMNIDFTIHKSHQFRIIYSGAVGTDSRAPIPADRKVIPWYPDIADWFGIGVNEEYVADRVRPFLPTDVDNPTHFFGYMTGIDVSGIDVSGIDVSGIDVSGIDRLYEFIYLLALSTIDWSNNRPNNKLCTGEYKYVDAVKQDRPLTAVLHKLEFLLPALGVNMFPYLLSIQKEDELSNNWPVYEPWLIWGFYLILVNHRRDDDDFGIDIFDLSPRWT